MADQIAVPDDFDRMEEAEIERHYTDQTGEKYPQALSIFAAVSAPCDTVPELEQNNRRNSDRRTLGAGLSQPLANECRLVLE
jgi:hypothetical protein